MDAATVEHLALATVTGSVRFPEVVGRLIEQGVEWFPGATPTDA
jgi:hypothetical protein